MVCRFDKCLTLLGKMRVLVYLLCKNARSPSSLYQRSGYALVGLYPILFNFSLKCSWNLADEVFKPYKDLSMIILFPCTSGPNSGPAITKTFSHVFPYRKAFPTSPAHTIKFFMCAM